MTSTIHNNNKNYKVKMTSRTKGVHAIDFGKVNMNIIYDHLRSMKEPKRLSLVDFSIYIKVSLVGLLSESSSEFYREFLSNVFFKKLFLSKKQRSWSNFNKVIVYGFTKTAPAPIEKLLARSLAKY